MMNSNETGKAFLNYLKISLFITFLGYSILFVSIFIITLLGVKTENNLILLHIIVFLFLNFLSYVLNSKRVFETKLKIKTAFRFFAVSAFNVATIYLLLGWVDGILQNTYIASFVLFTIIGVNSFFFHKYFTFVKI